jgi:hypothetical protein
MGINPTDKWPVLWITDLLSTGGVMLIITPEFCMFIGLCKMTIDYETAAV